MSGSRRKNEINYSTKKCIPKRYKTYACVVYAMFGDTIQAN